MSEIDEAREKEICAMCNIVASDSATAEERKRAFYTLVDAIDPSLIEDNARLLEINQEHRRRVEELEQRLVTALNEAAALREHNAKLLKACKAAREAIRDNLKMYQYKNEPLLLEAFQQLTEAIAIGATDAN